MLRNMPCPLYQDSSFERRLTSRPADLEIGDRSSRNLLIAPDSLGAHER